MQGALLFGTALAVQPKRQCVSFREMQRKKRSYVGPTAHSLLVRQTASDTRLPLLNEESGSIISSVRNERLSSLAIVRFAILNTNLDPRQQSEAGPFVAIAAAGWLCADGIRRRSLTNAPCWKGCRAVSL